MNYKIIDKETFKVIGKKFTLSMKSNNQLKEIPVIWEKLTKDGTCDKLDQYSSDLGVMGITVNYSEEEEVMEYMIGIEKNQATIQNINIPDLKESDIPAFSWATFYSDKPVSEINQLYQRIFSEWFPATGYEHAGGPELEIYHVDEQTGELDSYEIWIPVKQTS